MNVDILEIAKEDDPIRIDMVSFYDVMGIDFDFIGEMINIKQYSLEEKFRSKYISFNKIINIKISGGIRND